MESLYTLNDKLSKIWKLGRLQVFMYPAICFGLLAAAVIFIAILQYLRSAF